MKRFFFLAIFAAFLTSTMSGLSLADGSASKKAEHGSSSKSAPALPKESASEQSEPSGGQAAFAEIERIVMMLDRDPATDWSSVDIEGLRLHLIDMDNVVMRARVQAEPIEGGAVFTVTSDLKTVQQSIQTMARAHGMVVAMGGEMSWETKMLAQGAEVTVTGPNPAKIRGLGYVGLLTYGGHHNVHHEMMAKGADPH